MARDMPAAEVAIDEDLVRALLRDQHPDLADRPLRPLAFGWDNVSFRLGDDLLVRLPRREASAALIEHEQRWLPELAPRLPLPVPVPVRIGRPTDDYPWPWTVCRYLDGDRVADDDGLDVESAAVDLGRFVVALHRPAPEGVPHNPYRGIPLAERAEAFEVQLAHADVDDHELVRRRWADLASTPPWPGPPIWLHGDLHPANVLSRAGRITAVIDWGDLTAGDPATDLAVAWMLLPPEARRRFRLAAGDVDDDTWRRAQAWALCLAIAVLASSADNPGMRAIGARTLDAVLADG